LGEKLDKFSEKLDLDKEARAFDRIHIESRLSAIEQQLKSKRYD
jgi:hypothetical protein